MLEAKKKELEKKELERQKDTLTEVMADREEELIQTQGCLFYGHLSH